MQYRVIWLHPTECQVPIRELAIELESWFITPLSATCVFTRRLTPHKLSLFAHKLHMAPKVVPVRVIRTMKCPPKLIWSGLYWCPCPCLSYKFSYLFENIQLLTGERSNSLSYMAAGRYAVVNPKLLFTCEGGVGGCLTYRQPRLLGISQQVWGHLVPRPHPPFCCLLYGKAGRASYLFSHANDVINKWPQCTHAL